LENKIGDNESMTVNNVGNYEKSDGDARRCLPPKKRLVNYCLKGLSYE
jgi:hypothetical protein